MSDWTTDIEEVLECIRINSVILSKEHSKLYFSLKHFLLYFRLPVIILSGINSVVSVGANAYIDNQSTISMVTCFLALICSIIGSIELYLSVQKRMETELITSKDYYFISVDIQKTLLLNCEHRPVPAKEYLDKMYNQYIKLMEVSNLLNRRITDKLTPLPINAGLLPSTPSSKNQLSEEDEPFNIPV